MPPTQPPNLGSLPHELATFVVRGQLAAHIDDDLAAQLESAYVEAIAEQLLAIEADIREPLLELARDLAPAYGIDPATLLEEHVTVALEPEGIIAAQRARLTAR